MKTEISHTPGPWAVGIKSLDVYHPRSGYLICRMGDEAFPDIIPSANARLIAAAPAMLEAARECSEAITAVNQAAGITVFNPAATELLRAAIAQAEGKNEN